jgi:galactose-1-phosphate uridylyltransferase
MLQEKLNLEGCNLMKLKDLHFMRNRPGLLAQVYSEIVKLEKESPTKDKQQILDTAITNTVTRLKNRMLLQFKAAVENSTGTFIHFKLPLKSLITT